MTRLAFHLNRDRHFYAAAASRIGPIKLVGLKESPEAIVTDNLDSISSELPTLLIGARPPEDSSLVYPALTQRFEPEALSIRQSLESGHIGRLGLVRQHAWAPQDRAMTEHEKIGIIDLALWFFDGTPEVVHTTARHPQSTLLHLGFKGGGMALITLVESLPPGDGYRSLCVIGSNGAAYADDHRNKHLLFTGGSPRAVEQKQRHAFIQPMLEAFLKDLKDPRLSSNAQRAYANARTILKQTEAMT